MTETNKNSVYKAFNDTCQCIYIHIPKVAGISIETALFNEKVGHKFAKSFLNENQEKFYSYYKFTFVRNPYDRLASAFFFLKNGGRNEHDKKWSDTNLSNISTFEDFVKKLRSEEFKHTILSATHFIPQYKWICDDNHNILVDFIGRFEDLSHDFKYISQKIKKDTLLPHENKTSNRKPYYELYTEEMEEIVHLIYKKDFELLHYNKEIIPTHNFKKNIFVHIGYPKAASTTLQKHLFHKHTELLNLGLYPTHNIGNDTNEVDANAIYIKDEKVKEFYNFLTHADFAKTYSKNDTIDHYHNYIKKYITQSNQKIIFSHERFTSVLFSFTNYREKAKRLAHVLPDAKIVIIIRDQYSWLKSQYRDHPFDPRDILKSKMISFDEWFQIIYQDDNLKILPMLDYYNVIKTYEELFGSQNIGVFLFEDLVKKTHQFSNDISEFMDIDSEETYQLLQTQHENQGVGHLYNLYRGLKRNPKTLKYIKKFSLEALDKKVESFLKKSKKKNYFLSEKNLTLLNNYYEKSNNKLVEEYNLNLTQYSYLLQKPTKKIKIGLYLENKNISDVDLSNPQLGNPGIGGTQFNFISLVFYYQKYFNNVEFIIYANTTKNLPNQFQTVCVNDCLEAYLQAEKSSCTIFIWRPFLRDDTIKLLDLSQKHSLNMIAWMHSSVPDILDNMLATNDKVKAYVTVSQEQLKEIKDPAIIKKSFIICNGFDTLPYKTISPIQKDPYMVTYVGSLIPDKGFGLLAKIWKKVLESEPKATLFVIGSGQLYNRNTSLGKWGVAEENFEATEIRPYLSDNSGNIHPSVHFLGTLGSEKIPYLQKSCVGVVNPSAKTENCPGSAIEFQAAKTPVVSKAEKGLLDTVIDKETGLLGYSEQDLIDNILFFLKKNEESYLYGERGQKFIEEKFNYQIIATQWQRLFHSLQNN